jgi:hypothetical protein
LKFSNTYEAETLARTKLLNTPNKTASWIYSNYVSQLKRAGYDASVEGIKKGKKRAKRKNDVSNKRQKILTPQPQMAKMTPPPPSKSFFF